MASDDDTSLTRDSVDSFLQEMVRTPAVGGAAPLAPGTIVDGQYRIERALGHGGMGVVFLARDLRLDRDVALKVGHVVSETALGRIEREAVALARLQHPNVVVIHQVGEIGGRLYIAMEHVDGGNAREWLRARRRGWREVVALYAAAGDGLAAAHAAGFVHRDFKPDNVLVGKDGRPRVADFGLVRGLVSDDADRIEALPGGDGTASGRVTDRMTETGAVVGTPAYMAPEQIEGEQVDARADQFAFCAALWEALFSARPYAGRTPAEIASAIESTAPRVPADGRRVPRRLIAALRRGLERDRAARWLSMTPLLAELRRDPRARRRIALAVVAAAAAAGTIAVIATRASASDPCADGASVIARTWSPARAAEIAAAFDKAGLARSWTGLHDAIDRYTAAWAIAHDDACRATRVDGSQSEAVMDHRMLCLSRARGALDLLLDGATASRATAARAPDAIGALPDLARCADVATLAAQTPLPADPARRARIDAAAQLVEQARLGGLTGDVPDARGLGDRTVAAARDTAWPPLVAQATLARADLLDGVAPEREVQAEQRKAVGLAFAAGDDETAAWALADLAIDLADFRNADEADHTVELARGLVARMGDRPALEERLAQAAAQILMVRDDGRGAVAETRRRIAFSQRAYPNSPIARANEHRNLAKALFTAEQLPEARREIDLAIGIVEEAHGPDHPLIADYLLPGVDIAERAGDLDRALALARRAVAITGAWYDARDPRVGGALTELGSVLSLRGELDEARTVLQRALAIEGALSPYDLVAANSALAIVEARSGHDQRAVELSSRAIAEIESHTGPDSHEVVADVLTRGIAARHLGHLDDSQRDLERAVRISAATYGPDNPEAINARIELSYTLVAARHAADAAALLEPWLAAAHASGAPSVDAELHTALADAIWQAGGDRARARTLAQQGLDLFTQLGDAFADDQARARAWLSAH